MKLIDLLGVLRQNDEIIIKHMLGSWDSQHYMYRDTVKGCLRCPCFPYYSRTVYKVIANDSTIIIQIF